MYKLTYWIKNVLLAAVLIILISITSFADQIYYYAYTTDEESYRIPYKQQSNLKKPIIVMQNNDDTYTVINGDNSEVLSKSSFGTYIGGFDGYYILDGDWLNLSGGISDDYYSLTPFTEGWIKPDNDKWYYLGADGSCVKNQWVGNYYLGYDGAMLTNSWTPDGYYVGSDGAWNGQSTITTNNKSLDGVYIYAYTKFAYQDELQFANGISPITVIRNHDGSYTASDSNETTLLTLDHNGSYSGGDFEYWRLDENGLMIELGEGAAFYTKK